MSLLSAFWHEHVLQKAHSFDRARLRGRFATAIGAEVVPVVGGLSLSETLGLLFFALLLLEAFGLGSLLSPDSGFVRSSVWFFVFVF
jgi:hypothetical protein